MSLPGGTERQQLSRIADDLREAFSERGHRIDVALDADSAFGSGSSRSSLTRELVMDAVAHSASQVGLGLQAVNGPGRELLGEEHRYRIRRAKRDALGNLVIHVSTDSSLGDEEDLTFFPRKSWVFGWMTNGDGLIEEVFVAGIVGVVPGHPGRLILGPELALGSDGPCGGGGFNPTQEDLDLGLDEEGDDESGAVGA